MPFIQIRCSCCWKCNQKPMESVVLEDNCCGCNFAAFAKMCDLPETYVVYINYHVDVGETPFLVALDFSRKAIVISIRGTLSLEVRIMYIHGSFDFDEQIYTSFTGCSVCKCCKWMLYVALKRTISFDRTQMSLDGKCSFWDRTPCICIIHPVNM